MNISVEQATFLSKPKRVRFSYSFNGILNFLDYSMPNPSPWKISNFKGLIFNEEMAPFWLKHIKAVYLS